MNPLQMMGMMSKIGEIRPINQKVLLTATATTTLVRSQA
jgi:hypothetical protein